MACENELVQERRKYGHDFIDHPDPAVSRSFAGVALQLRLGILAQRRAGTDPVDCDNPRLNWTPVNVSASLRKGV